MRATTARASGGSTRGRVGDQHTGVWGGSIRAYGGNHRLRPQGRSAIQFSTLRSRQALSRQQTQADFRRPCALRDSGRMGGQVCVSPPVSVHFPESRNAHVRLKSAYVCIRGRVSRRCNVRRLPAERPLTGRVLGCPLRVET